MKQNKTKKPYEPAEIKTLQFAMEDVLAFSNTGLNDNEGNDIGGWDLSSTTDL